ncbi:MAG: hypothetical protein OXF20_12865 [Gammaproteobacteria bacterium]|nr:hypothetical protein [Gammaproteobacteria bacterium]
MNGPIPLLAVGWRYDSRFGPTAGSPVVYKTMGMLGYNPLNAIHIMLNGHAVKTLEGNVYE